MNTYENQDAKASGVISGNFLELNLSHGAGKMDANTVGDLTKHTVTIQSNRERAGFDRIMRESRKVNSGAIFQQNIEPYYRRFAKHKY